MSTSRISTSPSGSNEINVPSATQASAPKRIPLVKTKKQLIQEKKVEVKPKVALYLKRKKQEPKGGEGEHTEEQQATDRSKMPKTMTKEESGLSALLDKLKQCGDDELRQTISRSKISDPSRILQDFEQFKQDFHLYCQELKPEDYRSTPDYFKEKDLVFLVEQYVALHTPGRSGKEEAQPEISTLEGMKAIVLANPKKFSKSDLGALENFYQSKERATTFANADDFISQFSLYLSQVKPASTSSRLTPQAKAQSTSSALINTALRKTAPTKMCLTQLFEQFPDTSQYQYIETELLARVRRRHDSDIGALVKRFVENCDWRRLSKRDRYQNPDAEGALYAAVDILVDIFNKFDDYLWRKGISQTAEGINNSFLSFCRSNGVAIENWLEQQEVKPLRELMRYAYIGTHKPEKGDPDSPCCAFAFDQTNNRYVIGFNDMPVRKSSISDLFGNKLEFLGETHSLSSAGISFGEQVKEIEASFREYPKWGSQVFKPQNISYDYRDHWQAIIHRIAKTSFHEKFPLLNENSLIRILYNERGYNKVHAELHVISDFMKSHIKNQLAAKRYNETSLLPDNFKLFVGISMLCCHNCNHFISRYNENVSNGSKIIVQGTHNLRYPSLEPVRVFKEMIMNVKSGLESDLKKGLEKELELKKAGLRSQGRLTREKEKALDKEHDAIVASKVAELESSHARYFRGLEDTWVPVFEYPRRMESCEPKKKLSDQPMHTKDSPARTPLPASPTLLPEEPVTPPRQDEAQPATTAALRL